MVALRARRTLSTPRLLNLGRLRLPPPYRYDAWPEMGFGEDMSQVSFVSQSEHVNRLLAPCCRAQLSQKALTENLDLRSGSHAQRQQRLPLFEALANHTTAAQQAHSRQLHCHATCSAVAAAWPADRRALCAHMPRHMRRRCASCGSSPSFRDLPACRRAAGPGHRPGAGLAGAAGGDDGAAGRHGAAAARDGGAAAASRGHAAAVKGAATAAAA